MTDMFATYGPDVVAWVLAALGTLLSTYVFAAMKLGWAREVLARAWLEVQGAVAEINQVYVDELRKARADGDLTDQEKAYARSMAIEKAKENIGKKGLARVARIVGIDAERWIASKVEQAVALSKLAPAGVALPGIVENAVRAATAPPDPRRPA